MINTQKTPTLKRLSILAAGASVAMISTSALAVDTTMDSEAGTLSVVTMAEGLESPWGMEFLPDGSLIVTEKAGTIRMVAADGTVGEPLTGLPDIDAGGQGGLLDIALDPTFAENRFVYITYSQAGEGGNSTAAGRGRLADDNSGLESFQPIFTQMPLYEGNKHFGSRIVFGGEGHLFIGLGERSDANIREGAQDLGTHLGKVVRINADGSVPEGNPFVGQDGALPEIWSYGQRNIQGGAVHPETGAIWFSEHGPKGGDEINVVEAGKNYGWPVVSYGVNYNGTPVGTGKATGEGFTQPVHQWTPVIGAAGMDFYTADLVPAWKGSVFVGGLATENLVRLSLDGTTVTGEERLELGARIRDVKQGPDGAIYVLAEDDGEIVRLAPAASAATSG
ncbi:MAG: PQQ-dependent sugar dehydrogenase [Rhizobiaceae bacterium]|nr:PQQ-dependent sugar dehydrogenase [Rhizobiaceae bacterium]